MYYRKALRVAGFDPADIKDAKKSDEFILSIGPKELRGSRIGHPMYCAGAKACKKLAGVTFAWVGASMALLGYSDGRIIRYMHNGKLQRGHDQGMFAIGDYKFRHVIDSERPETRKRNSSIRPHHNSKGLRGGIMPEVSLAAQMRRGWEVKSELK